MSQKNKWIVGGDIYNITATIRVSRHVEGAQLKLGEFQTNMTLNALDSGKQTGRIALYYKKNYIYPAKETSRSFATLRTGCTLSEDQQVEICAQINM